MKKPVCRSSNDSTLIITGEYNSVLTCPVSGSAAVRTVRMKTLGSKLSSHHVFKDCSLSQ